MKNKFLIFSLSILTTILTVNFIFSNQDIENAINNSDISQLNLLLDNKSKVKKRRVEKICFLS